MTNDINTQPQDKGNSDANVQDPKLNPQAGQNDGKQEEGKTPETKTFTQEEVQAELDRVAAKTREEERRKAEKTVADAVAKATEEAERTAKMTAEEKAREDTKKKADSLSQREQEITLKENTLAAKEQLAEAGVPQSLVTFVASIDSEKQTENIKLFVSEYNKAVEAGVKKALAGDKPKDFSNPPNNTAAKPAVKQHF